MKMKEDFNSGNMSKELPDMFGKLIVILKDSFDKINFKNLENKKKVDDNITIKMEIKSKNEIENLDIEKNENNENNEECDELLKSNEEMEVDESEEHSSDLTDMVEAQKNVPEEGATSKNVLQDNTAEHSPGTRRSERTNSLLALPPPPTSSLSHVTAPTSPATSATSATIATSAATPSKPTTTQTVATSSPSALVSVDTAPMETTPDASPEESTVNSFCVLRAGLETVPTAHLQLLLLLSIL